MEDKMKKVGLTMSIFMGVTLSFFLSLVGNSMGLIQSGMFSKKAWLISFGISTAISLVIGFIVPMGKISRSIQEKNGGPGSLKARLKDTLVSDLIYTPIISFVMVIFAHQRAKAHGATMAFGPMFLSSLLVCFIVAYILIFFISPLLMKAALKINKVEGGPPAQAPEDAA